MEEVFFSDMEDFMFPPSAKQLLFVQQALYIANEPSPTPQHSNHAIRPTRYTMLKINEKACFQIHYTKYPRLTCSILAKYS